MSDYYEQNTLDVDKSLRNKMEDLLRELFTIKFNFDRANYLTLHVNDPTLRKEQVDLRTTNEKIIADDLPTLVDVIEKEMRKILKIDEN